MIFLFYIYSSQEKVKKLEENLLKEKDRKKEIENHNTSKINRKIVNAIQS